MNDERHCDEHLLRNRLGWNLRRRTLNGRQSVILAAIASVIATQHPGVYDFDNMKSSRDTSLKLAKLSFSFAIFSVD